MMFSRQDLFFPQQEIIVTRNTNRDSWVGQCEVFNRSPSECVGVMVRQLDRNYHYNYRLLEGSNFLLQPSGSRNDFHCFKFMVVFNEDKANAVGETENLMKGADREEIERMVEKGHSLLLEDLCVVYGNVLNSSEWKTRLEKFAPYRAHIRVRIPSLPFNKRRTILIPEVGAQNHRVNESSDILQDVAVSHQEELDQGYQQLRKVLRIKKFTDFEIRAQKLFRNFTNPSEPYRAEHAEVFPNRYIQFKRETRIQLKKGKRSYNPWIGEVTIRNHAPSHYLIYKLRTTAPQHYVVMPTEGVLMPRFRRKMFSLKYQTTRFADTLEHLNKANNASSGSDRLMQNMSAVNEDIVSGVGKDDPTGSSSSRLEAIQPDSMMDKKFFRSSVARSAPQNKVLCENHRFADTQNFASLARDTLNEKEHEEQADSVSIRFLYSDVIAEGEALSSEEGTFGGGDKSAKKKQQQQLQRMHQKSLQSVSPLLRRANRNRNNYCSPAAAASHQNSSNANSYHMDGYHYRSSSTSDLAGAGLKMSGFDGFYNDRTDGNAFLVESASAETSRSSAELMKLLGGSSGRDDDSVALRMKVQKRKEQATWMKMTSTERNSDFKDEKNHVQSHVFLLDVAFVDPYAVDERNYNIEELFRHTETLTGGYKMSRCFYPYFVPEDTISGPVIVYPDNDVTIDRGIGSSHVHWLTEIYLVNIHKLSLYYCIIPQEEDHGQLEFGDEILVTPRSGYLLHYTEKRQSTGIAQFNMSESLCEQIQIYLRYTRTCQLEDGPIFKLHIFFFTESAAPEWLKNPALAELLDLSDPTYCNPLSDALDVATVRVFIKDAEQPAATKEALSCEDLADTEDLFRPLYSQYSDATKDFPLGLLPTLSVGQQRRSQTLGNQRQLSAARATPLNIQDAAAPGRSGFSELLHHASQVAATNHRWRDADDPLPEVAPDRDKAQLDMTLLSYAPDLLTPACAIRAVSGSQQQQEEEEDLEEAESDSQEERLPIDEGDDTVSLVTGSDDQEEQ